MNLEPFTNGRLVVLRGEETAYAAARAMLDEHVGAVLVADGGEVDGIVTDRDLLLRAGPQLTLEQIPLRQVMTPHPYCIAVSASPEEAATLMCARRIRRLVVLENGRPAGIVSLDDLLFSEAVSRALLQKVVRAQLGEASPRKPAGLLRPEPVAHPLAADARHQAHRERSLQGFGSKLSRLTGLRRTEDAVAAFEVVAGNLMHRASAKAAENFAAQLPELIRKHLEVHAEPDRNISRSSIERDVANRLGVDSILATEVVWRIGQHLNELVSDGEVESLAAQLPNDLKRMLRPSA